MAGTPVPLPLNQLNDRGTVQGTDVLPILPLLGTTLQKTSITELSAYFTAGLTPYQSVVAAANLTAGRFVSITAAGVVHADATDDTLPADGFITDNFLQGATAKVYGPGQVNGSLSALTMGSLYFLSTNGGVTASVPSSGALQIVGKAWSTISIMFTPGPDQLL